MEKINRQESHSDAPVLGNIHRFDKNGKSENRKMAEDVVSKIITAYSESWSPIRYDLYATILENIFNRLDGTERFIANEIENDRNT